jgi:hypothetical protein
MSDVFRKTVKIFNIMSEIPYLPVTGYVQKSFFISGKTMILPEMFFLLFLRNINAAVQPFICPPLALLLPCSIKGTI